MTIKTSSRVMTLLVTMALLFSMFSTTAAAAPSAVPSSPVTFTILHTNDFHGQLQAADPDPDKVSTPGMARTARVINQIRAANTALGQSTLLVDGGDEMQGSLLSNLGDGTATGKGAPTIATFNQMAYDVATFGNHEFDWGKDVLAARTTQATYPFVTANIVQNDTGSCATAGWTKPDFADAPYVIKTIGSDVNAVKVAFIGVSTLETPTITVATATAGLCFKDPTLAIEHYYDQMKTTDGADVIVVLSHLGYTDGGYGYGIPVYGDQTLAKNLINDGKPVNLIIGGHSHTSVAAPGTTVTVTGKVGSTLVTQSASNGRRVGQAAITVGTDGSVSITWKVTVWTQKSGTNPAHSEWRTFTTSSAYTADADVSEDAGVAGVINTYATNPDYVTLVNTPIGYSAVDLGRNQIQTNPGATNPSFATMRDNMMSTFIDDAIYNYLNTDGDETNNIDIFFNNAGGIRTDWCYVNGAWQTSACTASGLHNPGLLTYGNMFTVLPFGNATVVGKMTGAHILEVLNQGPLVSNGVIQVSGLKYKYFRYTDSLAPGTVSSPYPYAWGAYDVQVYDGASWKPLDLAATYNVGTNEFLAPAGGDGYSGFKYMTNITYWGDMLNAVNAYVNANYGTEATAYKGPIGDGSLDERITIDGNGDFTYDAGEIVPLTVLHHNDPHGNLYKNGTYAGLTQLATLIKQEKAHNPTRTLLFGAGDTIQGDGISFYFKSAYTGKAVDGTVLNPDPISGKDLTTDPIIAAMNLLQYDAMTLGNHEFNFGSDVFKGVLGQANFPILDAVVTDGAGGKTYGLATANHGVGVQAYIEKTLGTEGIKVGIMGLGNPRIPNYELPSNILGLTFGNNMGVDDPITRAQTIASTLRTNKDDVVLALTHLGFTDPTDQWVDTYLATHTTGIDAIIGGHSHTDPTNSVTYPYLAPYKFLPGIWAAADGKAVAINTAYRYNYLLGEMVMGLRANGSGGYDVVSQTGRNIAVCAGGKTGTGATCPTDTAEDTATANLIAPYKALFTTYNNTPVGITSAPVKATTAFTEETTGANLQADAAVYELATKLPDVHVDFHLSGAMTNRDVATTAGESNPVTLKVSDMFTLMPYENSLVVLSMNGPQLKTVLERAYSNYWNYKYTSHSNVSYYTTCMLDTNSVGRIYYRDTYPAAPNGNNVVALIVNGKAVDFNDVSKYYNVSTVNYLAAGSCNFSDSPGTSLWPLNQTVADTQYYVRDAVIDYITAMGTVSPKVEGRLLFGDTTAPVVTVSTPAIQDYLHPDFLTLDFSAVDGAGGTSPLLAPPSGVKSIEAKLGSATVTNGQKIDLHTLSLGTHTLTVTATDYYGNTTPQIVTFNVSATVQSVKASVNRLYAEGAIMKADVRNTLLQQLDTAQMYLDQGNIKAAKNSLNAFMNLVKAQSGKAITKGAASLLTADAQYVMATPK